MINLVNVYTRNIYIYININMQGPFAQFHLAFGFPIEEMAVARTAGAGTPEIEKNAAQKLRYVSL